MIDENKAAKIINRYLENENNSLKAQFYPISACTLTLDSQLCNELIDFLGDVYTCTGLDNNYEENIYGAEIQEVIQFLAFCRGNS
jgi:hypothetical protein